VQFYEQTTGDYVCIINRQGFMS